MRAGVNPIKNSKTTLSHKPHRVIIPIYIPDVEQQYYINAIAVLKKCLDSLFVTINTECTNVTLINNGSCKEVDTLISTYIKANVIDRYIMQSNRGKVEAVLKEARASYEEYITISDADVMFRKGWLENTLDIFKSFAQAGTVSPLPTPNIFAYCNDSALVKNFLSKKIQYASACSVDDLKEFESSIGSEGIYKSFYKKQFFIQEQEVKALLGSAHFVATYKSSLFDNKKAKVSYLFENGLEKEYLDVLAQESGLWRLGTCKAYVYHMGDSLFDEAISEDVCNIKAEDFTSCLNVKFLWFRKSLFFKTTVKVIIRVLKNTVNKNV